jgi:hypothetical protein
MHSILIAENTSEKLAYKTNGIEYVPDIVKHKYGESTRKPLEDMFLGELRFFEANYPGYKIFTLGSSLVFGETFTTYLTVCEFLIKDETTFANLIAALKASDQAIRRKMNPMWRWDVGAADTEGNVAFMVGWMDFAYFLQHRSDFLDHSHGHYMRSFIQDQGAIKAKDYKVLHDGTIALFDPAKLSPADSVVFQNYKSIEYERIRRETLV